MSICLPCNPLKAISLCTDSIIVGKAPLANTAYAVYFRCLANDRIDTYYVTSDASKFLTIVLPDGFPLASGLAYEVWVNEQGDSIDTQLDLIIGVTTATCYTLSCTTVFNAYYETNQNYSSQTLEIA